MDVVTPLPFAISLEKSIVEISIVVVILLYKLDEHNYWNDLHKIHSE